MGRLGYILHMPNQYVPGQKVALVILRETDLGFVAEINGADEGLLYHDEIFEVLRLDQEITGYINRVRENGKIDLILQPFGNFGAEEIGEKILAKLEENNGFLPVNDHSSPEKIYQLFDVSKKKFKIALGGLYKRRLVLITEKGIELVRPKP
ncbi:MAG: hypothetical protein ABL958_11115 [Bdellovibrionia bacterium]